jgi:hypothetical protein
MVTLGIILLNHFSSLRRGSLLRMCDQLHGLPQHRHTFGITQVLTSSGRETSGLREENTKKDAVQLFKRKSLWRKRKKREISPMSRPWQTIPWRLATAWEILNSLRDPDIVPKVDCMVDRRWDQEVVMTST